ncbi:MULTISPECIES: propanediol utilization kinase [Desulfitobacterium]|uniref:Putative kinase involved in propanediol utilization n=1 Tax=Desulfitobacterium dehalogenans (strain ATCC 51507 / DSM 9161 / JW/IU-DC1) TaxID=756499 RepID=I4A6T5_DESDJ|nr:MULTISPECIES: propanediol utilization kinase [Desulfitobacterium]AFL99669.1 putative kinase involved in propanediol utilization [Desulfitobacterium dehalogenans ATCC 51507]
MRGLGWAKCPGTCGEWVQGAKDGIPFLVGCPINRFVEAKAEILFSEPTNKRHYAHQQELQNWIWELPEGKEKTRQALERFARSQNLPSLTGKLRMKSQLLVGKGMASSTADMTAAVSAVAHALAIPWEPEEQARLALAIEPSDPIMFPGVTELAHGDGRYIKSLGSKIPAQLLMLDGGGFLDTLAFNARRDLPGHYRKYEFMIKNALALFYEGMDQRDLEKIARASTVSAQCNQDINPKPFFEDFLSWILGRGGLGVIAAHSGTLLAGIFPAHLSTTEKRNLQRESHIQFRPGRVEWVETYDGGIEGGVMNAWRKPIGSLSTVWKTELY